MNRRCQKRVFEESLSPGLNMIEIKMGLSRRSRMLTLPYRVGSIFGHNPAHDKSI